MALPLTPPDLSESGDLPQDLPAEAFAGADRKRFFNRRRARDPLGEGHAETWRTRLIKVAAEVLVRARRIVIRLSSSWPHLDVFHAISRRILDLAPKSSADRRAAPQDHPDFRPVLGWGPVRADSEKRNALDERGPGRTRPPKYLQACRQPPRPHPRP